MSDQDMAAPQDKDSQLRELRSKLDAGEFPAALAMSSRLLERHSGERALWQLHCQALVASSSIEQTVRALQACIDQFPDTPYPAFFAARALIKLDRFEDAGMAIETARTRGLSKRDYADFEAECAWEKTEWERLLKLFDRITEQGGTLKREQLLWTTRAHFMLGNSEAGDRAIEDYRIQYPVGTRQVIFLLRSFAVLGEQERTIALVNRALREGVDLSSSDIATELEQLLWSFQMTPELKATIQRLKSQVTSTLSQKARDGGIASGKLTPADVLNLSRALRRNAQKLALEFNYQQAAEMVRAQLDNPWPQHIRRQLGEFIAVMSRLSELPPAKRPVIDNFKGDFITSENGPDDHMVIIFTGLRDQLGMINIRLFDRFLAARGMGAIYLSDFNRMGYCHGIKSLAPNVAGTIEKLRGFLQSHGTQRLSVLGISSGGYASLRYGLLLGADEISCFSGGTVARPADMKRLGDDRVKVIARRIEQSGTDFLDPVRDVMTTVEIQPDIRLYFGNQAKLDRVQAEDIAHFDNVTLCPIAGYEQHNVFTHVLGSGELFNDP